MTHGKGGNGQEGDKDSEERYQIAISYAHSGSRPADLRYFEQTAKELKELGLCVFYSDSKEEQEKLLGKKLDGAYYDVFSKAEYILVFISWQYIQEKEEREILDMERRIAFSPLSLETGSIFPVVFDIEALPMNLKKYGYLFVKDYENPTPSELAKVIRKRYNKRGKNTPDKSFFSQGIFNYLQGYIEGAVKDFDEAIKQQPDFAEAYFNRGNSQAKMERHEKSVKDYDKVIKLQPNFPEAYYNRGNSQAQLERYEEAVKDYDEVINLWPDFPEAYYNRGNALANLERHEESVKDYDKAIRLQPDFAQAYNNRGYTKIILGSISPNSDDAKRLYEEAINDYNEAIKIQPKFARAYYNRYCAKNKLRLPYTEAVKDLNKAEDLGLYNDEN